MKKNFKGKYKHAKLEFPEGWRKETLSLEGGREGESGYFQTLHHDILVSLRKRYHTGV